MERIQSAIEKARARRQESGPAAEHPEAEIRPVPEPSAREAWREIPEFHPVPRRMQRNRILTFSGGADATAFDMMRTKVLQQMRANNWRRLAITSPGSACGKTTLCVNLAFSLARQPDERTVAIEMDMRQPALSRTLGLERGTQQFSRVLEGTADPADHMVRYRDNLAFGISRAPVRNPSELLHSETARQALADLERRLEPTVMIFDMPPMLACDDMLSFAGNVDCVLLVAAAESTSIREIDICERDLAAQTNVLGVALNKCRYTDTAYGGYYD